MIKRYGQESMNEKRDESSRGVAGHEPRSRENESAMGTGKKVALYGFGLLLLGLVVITIIIFLTGVYVPFEGTEGVGP